MSYYILEEDIYSPYSMEIGEVGYDLKRAILLGDYGNIDEFTEIDLESGLGDISFYKFPIVSQRVRQCIENKSQDANFVSIALGKGEERYHFNLMFPEIIECIDYEKSKLEKEEMMRLNSGFFIDETKLGDKKVFRVGNISNKIIVIHNSIKSELESIGLIGAKFTELNDYRG